MKARLNHQVSGKSEVIGDRLRLLIQAQGLLKVRFSIAYARWDGIGLLSTQLEQFLGSGGKFESIFGAANGVTTPDALYYGLLLKEMFPGQTYSGFLEDEFANAIYHPKCYEFHFADRVIVIIGSPNLTGGGLARNGELAVELSFKRDDPFCNKLSEFWESSKSKAKEVTVAEIARLAKTPHSGKEGGDEVGGANLGKPFLKVNSPLATKPIFKKVLGLAGDKNDIKNKILAGMGSISERPKHLYLQIFERETGGQKGKPGCAVQLPVATLGAYFGLSDGDNREVTFKFLNETVKSKVMHNSNHTHQVRISPIFSVVRPAIIHFERIGGDEYKSRFVSHSRYIKVLNSKCTEQRRKNSRRWGME